MQIKDLINQTENKDYEEVLEYIVKNSKNNGNKRFLVTINPEIIMLAKSDVFYEKVLRSADLIVPDGIGVLWAGKMFKRPLESRVHGSDLVGKVAEISSKKGITIGLVGGDKNIALDTKKCLEKTYTKAKIVFVGEEWNKIKTKKSCDVLFIAFGSPKQEKWIYENLPKINVKVAVGVGGAFDYISGRVRRAPKLVRRVGLEWLFRLIVQPWRIRRQASLVKFTLLVLKERFL